MGGKKNISSACISLQKCHLLHRSWYTEMIRYTLVHGHTLTDDTACSLLSPLSVDSFWSDSLTSGLQNRAPSLCSHAKRPSQTALILQTLEWGTYCLCFLLCFLQFTQASLRNKNSLRTLCMWEKCFMWKVFWSQIELKDPERHVSTLVLVLLLS